VNWLDFVLAGLLAVCVVQGLLRGFTRLALGLAATLAGLFLAIWFYGVAAAPFTPYVKNEQVANLLGFLAIFVLVQILGALVSWLAGKFVRSAGLDGLNRVLGAAFGILKAAVVGIILVMALVAFPVKPLPDSVAGSRLAPYFIEASHVLVYLAPRELKDGFLATYERVRKFWENRGAAGRTLPAETL
jgi:membrane protein required for colicin V production